MSKELPALLEAFENLPAVESAIPEYRLYYSEDGLPVSMSSGDFPDNGRYIQISKEIYDRPNYAAMRVVDGKLTFIENVFYHQQSLKKGGERFRTVKGHAGILVDETYQGETETYGFKNH